MCRTHFLFGDAEVVVSHRYADDVDENPNIEVGSGMTGTVMDNDDWERKGIVFLNRPDLHASLHSDFVHPFSLWRDEYSRFRKS